MIQGIFTTDVLKTFSRNAQKLHSVNTDEFYEVVAEHCNEVVKHIKPDNGGFSEAQLEIIRDAMLPQYVECRVMQALQTKMIALPAYAANAIEIQSLINANQYQIDIYELVLIDIIGLTVDVDMDQFAKTVLAQNSNMISIEVNHDAMRKYINDSVASMQEIPLIQNGKRKVN